MGVGLWVLISQSHHIWVWGVGGRRGRLLVRVHSLVAVSLVRRGSLLVEPDVGLIGVVNSSQVGEWVSGEGVVHDWLGLWSHNSVHNWHLELLLTGSINHVLIPDWLLHLLLVDWLLLDWLLLWLLLISAEESIEEAWSGGRGGCGGGAGGGLGIGARRVGRVTFLVESNVGLIGVVNSGKVHHLIVLLGVVLLLLFSPPDLEWTWGVGGGRGSSRGSLHL